MLPGLRTETASFPVRALSEPRTTGCDFDGIHARSGSSLEDGGRAGTVVRRNPTPPSYSPYSVSTASPILRFNGWEQRLLPKLRVRSYLNRSKCFDFTFFFGMHSQQASSTEALQAQGPTPWTDRASIMTATGGRYKLAHMCVQYAASRSRKEACSQSQPQHHNDVTGSARVASLGFHGV